MKLSPTASLHKVGNSDAPITDTVSVFHVPDMMFDRGVRKFMEGGGDPFAYIRGIGENFQKDADMLVGNLEGPITESLDCQAKAYSFRFDPSIAALLKRNRFDAVNLANNHTNDCYGTGIRDTRKYLNEAGIAYFGAHEVSESVLSKKVGDTRVAFIGIDETASSDAQLEPFYAKIVELRQTHDHIIVHIHWGFEYDALQNARQSVIGHRLIDSGADVVIGHHPHVVQPIEIYHGKAIFYSLGNFIFDQVAPRTNIGFAVGSVYRDGNMRFTIFPYTITHAQPELMPHDVMKKFCDNILKNISATDTCQFAPK